MIFFRLAQYLTRSAYKTALVGSHVFIACTGTSAAWAQVQKVKENVVNPYGFVAINGTIFFTATDNVNGYELWRTDGTKDGTFMVKDIRVGSGNSSPDRLTAVGEVLYFSADDGIHGQELWKSDGTAAGTVLVKDIMPSSLDLGSSYPDRLVNNDGLLFFTAKDGVHGEELWRSDGTAAGTVLVKDIYSGLTSTTPAHLTVMNGLVYFLASSHYGKDLWRSDGTAAGTTLVKDIEPGMNNLTSSNLCVLNGTIFFAAKDAAHGTELWKSDGTAAGTIIVKDINPTGDSNPFYLTSANGLLFFTAFESRGLELWRSDGSAAGTFIVKDLNPGPTNSFPKILQVTPQGIYLTFDDSIHGDELWKSDGTEAGTSLVKDITPTYKGLIQFGSNFCTSNGLDFFSVWTPATGTELWSTNGTEAGTTPVGEINPGAASASPGPLGTAGGTLYFGATDGISGRGLWMYNTKKAQTINFAPIPDRLLSDSSFTLTATASSNLPIVFTVVQGPATILRDGLITLNEVGQVTVRATQNGNEEYNAAFQEQTFTVLNVLGVPKSKTSDLIVYPNPATSHLVIQSASHSRQGSLLLTDTGGKVLHRELIQQSQVKLNLNYLPAGTYLLQIRNGTDVTVQKIVIR